MTSSAFIPTAEPWGFLPYPYINDPGVVAQTALVWGSDDSIDQAWTVFDSERSWSTTDAPGSYDVQSVATHELGHWLSLGDLYGSDDTEKTMYGYVSTGETKKRTLAQDDIDGIIYIYGS